MIAIIGKSILGQEIYDFLKWHNMNTTIISKSQGIEYIREDFSKHLKNAKCIIWTAGSYKAKNMEAEHVKPMNELVNALKKHQKLIYTSSISVYGKPKEKLFIEESTDINPDTPYAKAKAKAEEIAKGHKNTLILRLGVLYSYKYKAYSSIFKLISIGICPYFGKLKNHIPFTYIKDVLPCYKKAINGKAYDEIYNLAGKGCEQINAIQIASKAIGKKPFLISVPSCFGVFCDIFGCFLNTEVVRSLSSDRVVNNKRAVKYLGFKETPIKKGINKEVAQWKMIMGG